MLLSSLIDMNIHKFASVDDFMNVIKQAFCFLWEQWKKGVKFGQGIIYTSVSKYQQKGEARTKDVCMWSCIM